MDRQTRTGLVRHKQEKRLTHVFPVHFPKEIWARIAKHIKWGGVTRFIIQAVIEKMDREGMK